MNKIQSKRICHLTHTDVRKDSRILKEITALAEAFDEIDVHAIGMHSDDGPGNFIVSDKLHIHNIQQISRKIKPRILRHLIVFLVLCAQSFMLLLRVRPSVIHCHDTMVLPIGGVYSMLTGCKLIYDAHELESLKNGQTKTLSIITILFEKLFWFRVSLFITVSESIEKYYKQKYGSKNSILVLNSPKRYSGPNYPKITDVKSAFNFKDTDKIYLYIGIFSKGRGIENALAAFEQVDPSNKLVLVGWGVLESQIKSSERFGENIFIHPAIQHELLPNFAATADFGLCLLEPISQSDFFALPNKLFEYAFAGIPILGSNFPDMSQIIDRHNLGMCFEPTLNGLISAIKRSQKTSFQLLQVNMDELSWETQEKRLVSAYKAILGRS